MNPCQRTDSYISTFDLTSINKITTIHELTLLMKKILEPNVDVNIYSNKTTSAVELIRRRQQEITESQVATVKDYIDNAELEFILAAMNSINTEMAKYGPYKKDDTLGWINLEFERFKLLKQQINNGESKEEELKTCLKNYIINAKHVGHYIYNHINKNNNFDFQGQSFPLSMWQFLKIDPLLIKLNILFARISN